MLFLQSMLFLLVNRATKSSVWKLQKQRGARAHTKYLLYKKRNLKNISLPMSLCFVCSTPQSPSQILKPRTVLQSICLKIHICFPYIFHFVSFCYSLLVFFFCCTFTKSWCFKIYLLILLVLFMECAPKNIIACTIKNQVLFNPFDIWDPCREEGLLGTWVCSDMLCELRWVTWTGLSCICRGPPKVTIHSQKSIITQNWQFFKVRSLSHSNSSFSCVCSVNFCS